MRCWSTVCCENGAALEKCRESIVIGLRVREVGGRLRALRLGARHRCLGLAHLLRHLLLLVAHGRLRLANLGGHPFGAVGVVGLVGRELTGGDDGEELAGNDGVALVDEELLHLAAHLGADDDVVGGDDAGEDERFGGSENRVGGDRDDENGGGDQDLARAIHGAGRRGVGAAESSVQTIV